MKKYTLESTKNNTTVLTFPSLGLRVIYIKKLCTNKQNIYKLFLSNSEKLIFPHMKKEQIMRYFTDVQFPSLITFKKFFNIWWYIKERNSDGIFENDIHFYTPRYLNTHKMLLEKSVYS